MTQAIERPFAVSQITKSFDRQKVLRDLSLELRVGELTLLLGANGAGKSTLLRVLCGLSRPESGKLPRLPAASVGYSGHQLQLYSALTVRESIVLVARLSSCDADTEHVLSEWGLSRFAEHRISTLSRGTQYRCLLSTVFLKHPRFLFLDEPSAALDDAGFTVLMRYLQNTAHERHGVALVATHDLARFLPHAGRLLVLSGGQIAKDSAECGRDEVLDFYKRSNR